MRLLRPHFLFILIGLVSSGTHAQQVTSTWPFAEKIGWKGVQVNLGAATTGAYQIFSSIDQLKDISYSERVHEINALPYTPRVTGAHKFLQINGIFVPFRTAKNYRIAATEWQTGLEYQLETQRDAITKPVYGSFELRNRSLLWKNRLLFQQRFFSPNLKIYAGPAFGISLIPAYSFKIGKHAPGTDPIRPKYSEEILLSSAKRILTGGFAAGLKINLSCRFNFHFEYEYLQIRYAMQRNFLDFTMHSFALGVTYKFMKPDPVAGDPVSPFW